MQRGYLYFISLLLLAALVGLFLLQQHIPNGSLNLLYSIRTAIVAALLVLWNYHSKLVKESKERSETMNKGLIYFDLNKSYTNSTINYIVKYNDGTGDQIGMGTLPHIADVIRSVSNNRSYSLRIVTLDIESMHSIDAYAESTFFTPGEIDKLNSLLRQVT